MKVEWWKDTRVLPRLIWFGWLSDRRSDHPDVGPLLYGNRRLGAFDGEISLSAFKKTFKSEYLIAFTQSIKLAGLATIFSSSSAIRLPISFPHWKLPIVFLSACSCCRCSQPLLLRVSTINMLLLPEGFSEKCVRRISLNFSGMEAAVVLVMVVVYLPFTIFRSTRFGKIDPSLIEASKDLGAIISKLSGRWGSPFLKGVSSGIIMVFLPCATSFTIPLIVSRAHQTHRQHYWRKKWGRRLTFWLPRRKPDFDSDFGNRFGRPLHHQQSWCGRRALLWCYPRKWRER